MNESTRSRQKIAANLQQQQQQQQQQQPYSTKTKQPRTMAPKPVTSTALLNLDRSSTSTATSSSETAASSDASSPSSHSSSGSFNVPQYQYQYHANKSNTLVRPGLQTTAAAILTRTNTKSAQFDPSNVVTARLVLHDDTLQNTTSAASSITVNGTGANTTTCTTTIHDTTRQTMARWIRGDQKASERIKGHTAKHRLVKDSQYQTVTKFWLLAVIYTSYVLLSAHFVVAFQVSSHARARTRARWPTIIVPQTEKKSILFQSAPLGSPGGQVPPDDTNVDNVQRRRILFSMLHGSAALQTLPSNAYAKGDEEEGLKSLMPEVVVKEEMDTILRPPKDDREYLAYTLSNGLRVLLCSDPSTNEAAAAMDVHVGACSDPIAVPGLAHFTEHMSFLGSKPYPKEDAFSTFLASNGGISNAYTDSEDTVYYFDMEAEADNRLAEGLNIFGALFTSPLFTESATGRELNAIDSENAKNLQTDSFRIYQLVKSRANSDHPHSKFFTGNKKTLLDDTKANGINLRDELIKFYNRYYSANQMTLAIVAPQPISKLQEMVATSFSSIPNKGIAKPEEQWRGTLPYNGNSVVPSFQHIVEVVPVQDLRQATISWPILYPTQEEKQEALLEKQSTYVAHLIGHEGPGSLLSYLKRKRWANALASSTEAELSDFETFEVTVGLTTSGFANLNKVFEAIFSYLSMLKDKPIPDYVYQEVLQISELEWRFMTKGNVGGYAQSLSTSMQKYPPSLYVAGPRRIALAGPDSEVLDTSSPRTSFSSREQLEKTKQSVRKYISNLSLENAMITVISKSFQGKTDKAEKWYGTNYSVKPIPSNTLNQWQNCPSPQTLKIDYPRPNVFIPSEAGLRIKTPTKEKPQSKDFETRITPIPSPSLIRDDGPGGRWAVHYKADDRFGLPKAFVVFQLLSSGPFESVDNAALSNLYEACVVDRLGEYAYDASLAGLTYDLKVLPRGVRLTFGGYNDKLQKFAAYVSQKVSKDIKNILPRSDDEFERYKDQIMRALSAFDVKQPYAHASYYANLNIQPLRFQYTNEQLRDATERATLQDLLLYATTVWSAGKGQALVQGNLDEDEATFLVNQIDKTLGFRSIPESDIPDQLRPLQLPTSTIPATKGSVAPSSMRRTRLVVAEPNPVNTNAASYVMIQSLGESPKDHVLIELINAVVEQPFYDDLRTRQQLGYIVSSGVRGLGKTRTFSFIVQSSVAPVGKLTTETLKFMDGIADRLQKLPKVDLGTYVKGLIDRKLEPDKTLATEVMRNWAEIASGRLEFDRIQKEVLALLEVDKSDLLEFWNRIYVGAESRVLITQIVPESGPASSPLPPKTTGYASLENKAPAEGLVLGIDDIGAFRKDLEEGLI